VDESIPYGQNENLVGSIYNFSTSINQSGCKNCKNQAETNTLHTGQVPITGAMIKDAVNTDIGDFNHWTQDEIQAYLKKHLSWRVKAVCFSFSYHQAI
jgi:tyrosinase